MLNNKQSYKAFRVEEVEHSFKTSIKDLDFEPLMNDEIRVKVAYSSLNYKDALSASGNKGVSRNYPHTPGIDAVGIVEESTSANWQVGDRVIVTSYDLGMNTNGGFAEYIKVPATWALKLPESLSMKEAMCYGTAGLTAGMSVMELTQKVKPQDGKIVVSGATGGVGVLSIAILSKLGYDVVAITGKEKETAFLKHMGAQEILLRSEIENFADKPLLKPLFAGAIDTVGGAILENIIKSTQAMGTITCCGNAASPQLNMTVFPFILRGLRLIGIDSQNYPMPDRIKTWEKLSEDWKPLVLEETCTEIRLEDLNEKIALMLNGKHKGRSLVAIAQE